MTDPAVDAFIAQTLQGARMAKISAEGLRETIDICLDMAAEVLADVGNQEGADTIKRFKENVRAHMGEGRLEEIMLANMRKRGLI